jgi:hypothetical protein
MTIPAHHNLWVRLTCGVCSFVVETALLSTPAEVRAQAHDHSAVLPRTGTLTVAGQTVTVTQQLVP